MFQSVVPCGVQNARARRELGEVEEAELAPEAAVVAGARQLEALEVLGERLLGEERGAVDARQHRPRRVPAPVGAGDRLQREGLDRAGVGGVRARGRGR